MNKERRLFIVANRLPVQVNGEKGKATISPASGGLVSAVQSYLDHSRNDFSEVFWAGVPGCAPTVWTEATAALPPSTFTYLPVMVFREQYEGYYNGFANSVLWPLFHYFPSFAEYDGDNFLNYLRVNEHFAEVLERHCRENDVVWIHDYHLLPLAALLRKALPGITIGFFLHIPFPSYELFRIIPRQWQEELLKGMLGADLVGFHTADYAAHFLESVQAVLGVYPENSLIPHKDRLVKVDTFPISIDYKKFNDHYDTPLVDRIREDLKKRMNGRKIIFSVDRLDYTKGVQNRLKAFERLLLQRPEFRDQVVFVLVVVPSRDTISKYAERKRSIEELVSRINGSLGNLHWQPVCYQYQSISFDEMVALYTACEVALITPLRDGMNLVAKEFVASRKDRKGVLVLSEMAGSARELTDALLINPNDLVELSDVIGKALTLPPTEQTSSMDKMRKRVSNYTVTHWAEEFFRGMESIRQKQQTFQEIFLDNYSRIELLEAYRRASKRLLLLDYDGTLVPFASHPDLALPGPELLDLLSCLCQAPGNEVFIISGRPADWLEVQFKGLPLNLVAEHGARVKLNGQSWKGQVSYEADWKEPIRNLMEAYERKCPNAFLEEKAFSIAWHYRAASLELGRQRALELAQEIRSTVQHPYLEVLTGDKVIEVRSKEANKGTAVQRILTGSSYDFVFAVGDDKTDEDMFKVLLDKENSFTIKVGPHASYARYNLMKPQMVLALLESMKQATVQPGRQLTQ
jgi:trehalose 6-phosphate synthase/phosphatase